MRVSTPRDETAPMEGPNMNKTTQFLAAGILALSSLAVSAQDVTRDTVVATVNGVEITVGHMLSARAQLPADYQTLPAELLWEGLLDQIIQQQLLSEELEETPARVEIALENTERSLKAGEHIADLTQAAVSDEAVQALYDETYATATPALEYHAAHILVETQEEATAAIDRVNAGEDFAELAMELSTGPSGPNGGDLGWFGEGTMVAEFETAVMGMEVGAVSEPVQTQFGWHVIKLNETREKPIPTLDEVRSEIEARLQEQAILGAIEALEDEADITRPEDGAFDPEVINNMSILNQ